MKKILLIIIMFSGANFLYSAKPNYSTSELNNNPFTNNVFSEKVENIDKETDRFLKAKEYVFKRDWEKAKDRLKFYLQKYPSGQYVDETLYWLAQSLNKLSKNLKQLYLVVALKDEAANNLDSLLHKFPNSLWFDDAVKLRIALAGDLYVIGDKEQKKKQSDIIEKLWTKKLTDKPDIKFSFDVLIEMEPEVALDAIKLLLEEKKIQNNPGFKKEFITFIGIHFPENGLEILHDLERNDPDESVRHLASLTIDQIDMIEIPVHLNYFCYAADLNNKSEYKRLPENKSMIYEIPKTNSKSKKKIEKAIKQFFNHKLTDVKFASNGFGFTNLYIKLNKLSYKLNLLSELKEGHELFDTIKNYKKSITFGNVSHNISGFRVQILSDGFLKEYDQISGKVKFFDKEKEKEYIVPYTINNEHDKILAMRKENKVAIMVLQFESEEDLELDSEPIYHTKFGDVLGCTIHSSRDTWHMGEMSKVNGIIDFGLAKAEILTENGKWRLVGNLLSDGKTRRIIGRKAVLYNRKKEVIARGAQIIVPVDKPESFEVKGERNN